MCCFNNHIVNNNDTNKRDLTYLLIDVAISSYRNMIQNDAEKKVKYKNLSIEIQIMW
jgi:hypothetical protein